MPKSFFWIACTERDLELKCPAIVPRILYKLCLRPLELALPKAKAFLRLPRGLDRISSKPLRLVWAQVGRADP